MNSKLMKILPAMTFLAASMSLSGLAMADELKETYVARLSAKDHFNSSGGRLDSAAAIIRQDRANFHKFGRRDAEDESDDFFANARNRELLEKFLERGSATKNAIRAIMNGTPLVRVQVFTNERTGNDYIQVSVIEN